ncbi:MAG: hypothetical protein [Olavius algarvensis Gamma 1 endosymbiont]|nr:MAG: hypothetical protein [Olavius algarvensis Gamma 1 endosymbiont]
MKQKDDDLFISWAKKTSITIEDHFASKADRIETLLINSDEDNTIDLTGDLSDWLS